MCCPSSHRPEPCHAFCELKAMGVSKGKAQLVRSNDSGAIPSPSSTSFRVQSSSCRVTNSFHSWTRTPAGIIVPPSKQTAPSTLQGRQRHPGACRASTYSSGLDSGTIAKETREDPNRTFWVFAGTRFRSHRRALQEVRRRFRYRQKWCASLKSHENAMCEKQPCTGSS